MTDVFISYASEDLDRVRPLIAALETTQWSIFWDRTIPAGKTWRQVIGAEIQACRTLIVVWTEKSVNSEWVLEEAEIGKCRKILVPVLLDHVQPPLGFGSIQAANLVAWRGETSSPAFNRLVADIAAILSPAAAAAQESDQNLGSNAEGWRKPQQERPLDQKRQQTDAEAQRRAREEEQKRARLERPRLTLFHGLVSRIRGLPGLVKATAALVILLAFIVPFWRSAMEEIRRLPLWYRVMTAETAGIPLSTSALNILDAAIEAFTTSMSPDLTSPDRRGNEAWPVAQVVVAAKGLTGLDSKAIQAFFTRTSDRNCSCWKEFASANLPPNIPATGWVLTALAALKTGADSTVRFLLDQQNPEGWWSIFPVADDDRYASVYGTGLAVIALNSQLKQGLVSPKNYDASVQAVRRGAIWLLNHRAANSAQWRSYPLTSRPISESLSGLALHAVSQVMPDASANMTRQWIENLPREIPRTDAADPAALYDIETPFGTYNDHYVQIRLPWLLFATTDAYRGTTSTVLRVTAIRWLQRALNETGLTDAAVRQENWWRAELLMALRYVKAATEPTESPTVTPRQ